MEKQRWEESEKRRAEERRSEKRKSQKKEDAGARKGRDVAKHCVFPMICGSGGSQSRLAEAAGAEPSGQMRDEKLHAYVARSTFRSQNVQNTFKTHHSRTTFGSWDVARARAVVARSTFGSQMYKTHSKHTILGPLWKLRRRNSARRCGEKHIWKPNVQNTPFSDHFWKMRYCKSARRFGAKHIWKSQLQSTAALEHFWKLRCRKSARRCGAKHISKSKV